MTWLQKLSESFKNTLFALIRYHSGNETGMTEIYLNGTIISAVYGEEGDELRPALKPLNEFLHLKIKDVYNMLIITQMRLTYIPLQYFRV